MTKCSDLTGLIIGVDASNIFQGGGITHLAEVLRASNPLQYGISKIVVWGNSTILEALEERPWLEKICPAELSKGVMTRWFWHWSKLPRAAEAAGIDLLFVPGGIVLNGFIPVVTMSQNLLPFEWRELRRYGFSLMSFRLLLLRWLQSRSFHRADGVCFLTEYARDVVLRITGKLQGQTCIIPHGLNPRFNRIPKPQHSILDYDDRHPYRVLYVSIVDQYKHQWHVVEAVASLRKQGLRVVLDLVGPAYPPALKRLNEAIARVDADRLWVNYHGAIPHSELHDMYARVDMGIWASTCESFGLILLETMAAGLPIACSSKEPMHEILGNAGVYFDADEPSDIARALRKLIESPQLRTELAQANYQRARQFSWECCANLTLEFVAGVARRHKGIICRT